jgi:hypothetical protein
MDGRDTIDYYEVSVTIAHEWPFDHAAMRPCGHAAMRPS